jgi:hypothetical protein
MLRTHRTLILSTATLAALSMLSMGCGSRRSGDRGMLATGTTAPIGSQGFLPAAFGGATTLGEAADAFPAGSHLAGPNLEILSPARGAQLPVGRQPVEIQVTDKGQGIASVLIEGHTVTLDADGKGTVEIDLTHGLRTIVAMAYDNDNNRTERHVSVLVGELAQEGSEVAEAATVRLTDAALDQFEPKIAAGVEAQRPMIQQQVLRSNPPKDTKFTSFNYGGAKAGIDATPQGIRFQVDIANVALGIEYKAKFLFVFKKKLKGTLRANNLTISGLATPTLDPATGKITSTVSDVTARASGFSVPSWAKKEEGKLRAGFQQQFATAAATNLDSALNDALAKSKTQGQTGKTFFGKTIKADWTLRGLAFDDDGVNVKFSAAIYADNGTYGTDATLVRRTPSVAVSGSGGNLWNGALALHEDSLNQALHAAWRHGVLSFTVDQDTLDKMNSPVKLDTNTLLAAAPALEQILPKDVPIDLDVETLLPPIVEITPNMPHHLTISLGKVEVNWKVQDPATGGIVTLAKTIYALSVEARLEESGGKVNLVPTGNNTVHVDVVGKALPNTEPLVEAITKDMAPALVESVLKSVVGLALPTIKGFTFQNMGYDSRDNSLVITGSLVPAPAKTP